MCDVQGQRRGQLHATRHWTNRGWSAYSFLQTHPSFTRRSKGARLTMNAQTRQVMFSTASRTTSFQTGKDTWQTPLELFDELHAEFNFTVDGAACRSNHLLPRWWGPGAPRHLRDALSIPSWKGERTFINPPYSQVKEFVGKAFAERHRCLSVLLIPSRTDTRWWHQFIWHTARNKWRDGVEGRFIKGRLKFINPDGPLRVPTQSVIEGRHAPNNSAPFPSVVVVFGKA